MTVLAPEHRILLPAAASWITASVLVGSPTAAAGVAVGGLLLALLCTAVLVRQGGHRQGGHRRDASRVGRPPLIRRWSGLLLSIEGWAGLLAVALLGVGLVASMVAVRDASRSPPLLGDAIDSGRAVSVTLTVTDKTELQSRTSATPWDRSTETGEQRRTEQRIRGTVTELTVGGRTSSVSLPVVVFAEAGPNGLAAIGERVSLIGQARWTEPGEQAAALIFARGAVTPVSPPPAWLSWAPGMREVFAEQAGELPGRGGELLPGLAIGDTTGVSDDLDSDMITSSLSHLTAVSGANCAVIVAVIVLVLSGVGAPRWLRIGGGLAGLGLFVILVTPEPSVVRAALMAVAVLLSLGSGRPAAGLPVLSLVVLVIVISDPWIARSYGFVLSVLATGGLLTLTRPIAAFLSTWLPRPVSAGLAIPLAAQLACQPVVITLDASLPLYGVPANLLAAPAAPLATLLGLLACLCANIIPPLSWLALWLGWVPASWIAGIATTVSTLPASRVPWLAGVGGALALAAITVVLIAAMIAMARKKRVAATVMAALLVVIGGAYAGALLADRVGPRLALPREWSYAACDVGQGDAVVIRSGGAVALVDTGPDPASLGRCLDRLGIGQINLLVLSHFDLDHVGGVAAVVSRSDQVLTPPPENAADERMLRDLKAAGATVVEVAAGDSGTLGALGWQVLWPPGATRHPPSGNDGSVVLGFEGDGIRSLFLGDLSESAQEALLSTRTVRGTVDLVKVAHHGSADQSARLYQAIAARIGLISVGAGNDYGHPAPTILDTLRAAGTAPVRTDECGLVVVAPSGDSLTVWTEHAEPGCH
ncbi:hypothetical protein DF223_02035 [Mycetocola zhujimingii]|uniref:Metallo-beta-lactamase domain-containing protein n=1 Tax=Mycetocola zhujimingii TaxID=2079792 RepID=A0A2U1TH10_9MICO|nr:hypothetical protein DF223_02035 [Mycetocola zhujimingii]